MTSAVAKKAERLQEEDLRLKVRPGTKQALLELMEWAGIVEQGEAMALKFHRKSILMIQKDPGDEYAPPSLFHENG
ncbi:hypothetical protein QVM55_12675 [Pseudomonas monteilii]|uniref:hypothetical protein n=1 Tax=Pseudomonas monteilii TaxID=76759 RepID=UPI00352354C3